MKSILLTVNNDSGLEARMQVSLDLVRATSGHLTCLNVTPPVEYIGVDTIGGTPLMVDLDHYYHTSAAELRTKVELKLAHEDVNWDYIHINDDVLGAVMSAGALCDLIVLSSPSVLGRRQIANPFISEFVMRTHTPVLIVPETINALNVFGNAAVGWNGSFEAANALRAAMPMLRHAQSVTLVSIDAADEDSFPSTDALEYLSRHGIKATLLSTTVIQGTVEARLTKTAAELNADYLVMGAYSHSRMREYWFGGLTRSLFSDVTLPLFVAR